MRPFLTFWAQQGQILPDAAVFTDRLVKHGVSFELASTAFNDPRLFTVADLEHSGTEER